ncbi:hypothetical protein LZD49_21085 [Dyadobacter sp. CY261]|uniref:lanthionine synthetase LanC family protein n=1 Tax=Dyadobacter sp. CY261 TaxID=2907203 RepID=UPI001F344F9B|nr:lanthionine synthetase LanC family protein [Dyadobacter sp. CY261]MCF0072988.1 hypothetical protein [Dyadobacter sp. CY261]
MTTSEISGLSAMIATAKIDEIHEVVSMHRKQFTNFGFSRGYLGVSVFNYLYALHTGQKQYLDEARQAFEQACDMIDGDPQAAYPQDFTDLGAVVQYLHRTGVLDLDPNVFLGDVDVILLKKLRLELRAGNIGGFAQGALGYGLYFLHRSQYCQRSAKSAIEDLVQGIIQNAVHTPEGCYWKSEWDPRSEYTSPFFTQESTAILLFLSRIVEMGLVPASALEDIAQEAVKYKQAQRAKYQDFQFIDMTQEAPPPPSSLYYGEMGTGYTLLRAGATFHKAAWLQEGRAILKTCSLHDWEEILAMEDASVLSGATGLALMFDRVAQLTNDPDIQQTANFWYKQILRFDLHTDGYAGYKVADSPWHPQTNLSFSQGIIGIGCGLFKTLHPGKADFNDLIWLL